MDEISDPESASTDALNVSACDHVSYVEIFDGLRQPCWTCRRPRV